MKSPTSNDIPLNCNDENDEINATETFVPPLPHPKTDNSTKGPGIQKLPSQESFLPIWNSNHHQITASEQLLVPHPNMPAGAAQGPQEIAPSAPDPSLGKSQTPKTPPHKSPEPFPNTQNNHLSPIKLSNPFGPLLRPNKSLITSTTTLGSSSCSGPLFPPGFENTLPAQIKREREKKRKRKLEKKRSLKKSSSASKKDKKPSIALQYA